MVQFVFPKRPDQMVAVHLNALKMQSTHQSQDHIHPFPIPAVKVPRYNHRPLMMARPLEDHLDLLVIYRCCPKVYRVEIDQQQSTPLMKPIIGKNRTFIRLDQTFRVGREKRKSIFSLNAGTVKDAVNMVKKFDIGGE